MKIGFVGLGHMGEPIARNLLAAGHEVLVWNRTRSRADGLKSAGARVVATPAEASTTGLVLSMLADDRAALEVALGERGIASALPRDGTHASLSTIGLAAARQLSAAHSERGQRFVAAPVFGRPDAAAARRLVVVAAGSKAGIDHARPALEATSRSLTVLGDDPTSASLLKLAGNLFIASTIAGLGETLTLVRKSGIEGAKFLEVMNALFQSPVVEGYGKTLAQPPGEIRFAVRLGLKDVKLFQAAAEEKVVPHPVASLLENALLEAIARGGDEQDWSALGRVAARNVGLE